MGGETRSQFVRPAPSQISSVFRSHVKLDMQHDLAAAFWPLLCTTSNSAESQACPPNGQSAHAMDFGLWSRSPLSNSGRLIPQRSQRFDHLRSHLPFEMPV